MSGSVFLSAQHTPETDLPPEQCGHCCGWSESLGNPPSGWAVKHPQAPATTTGLQLLLAPQYTMWEQAPQVVSAWLTQSEQARLDALRHASRRREFIACRYALRQLLAATTGTATDHWQLDAIEGQAPHLNASHHGAEVAASTFLSLSHSGTHLACAVGSEPVGVDLEMDDARGRKRDVLALAAVACTDHEMQQLASMASESARHRRFLQWWTLKEAFFKRSGAGLSFASIRRVECRPWAPGDELQHLQARSWLGVVGDGHHVFLSVCATQSGVRSCRLAADSSIKWLEVSDWSLIAPLL